MSFELKRFRLPVLRAMADAKKKGGVEAPGEGFRGTGWVTGHQETWELRRSGATLLCFPQGSFQNA